MPEKQYHFQEIRYNKKENNTIPKKMLPQSRGSILTLILLLPEKDNHIDEERRDEDGTGPAHISKETGHFDAALFRNGFYHEVRGITDIGIGAHEYSTGRNRFEHDL